MQYQHPVLSAGFSRSGHLILTKSLDNAALVWKAETGELVHGMLHHGIVYTAAFSPDDRLIVTASADHTARVWEAETGKAVGAPLLHQGEVRSAAFSSDGHRIVTASVDGTVRVWEAETGKPMSAPMQVRGTIYTAAFSPDGHRIVIASEGQRERVWSAFLFCCASQEEANRLASLAEAVSSNEVSDTGSLTLINDWERLQELARKSRDGPSSELTLNWIIRRLAPEKADHEQE